MTSDKAQTRKIFKEIRKRLKNAEADKQMANLFSTSPFFKYSRFFVYASFGTEAGTEGVISALFQADKQVYLPRIEGENMLSARYKEGERLTRNRYGIDEAQGEAGECEIALVPLLAYDEKGNRLGYGGGYYDRYFLKNPSVLRVGYAYYGQKAEQIPTEAHDVLLDAVLTEKGIFVFSERAHTLFK
ncbi:MAG: 5-formyltetrahydrofolate cyclo-ligase [Clostridia bacterium]|nr:5-formyltetrahydrofolate cyclo-ligase [Clostridia bacterium]